MVPRQTPQVGKYCTLIGCQNALCVSVVDRERDGLEFGSSCGVEKKVRFEQFGSPPVSSVCVWPCVHVCVWCVCVYRSSSTAAENCLVVIPKLSIAVWPLNQTQRVLVVRLQTYWPRLLHNNQFSFSDKSNINCEKSQTIQKKSYLSIHLTLWVRVYMQWFLFCWVPRERWLLWNEMLQLGRKIYFYLQQPQMLEHTTFHTTLVLSKWKQVWWQTKWKSDKMYLAASAAFAP